MLRTIVSIPAGLIRMPVRWFIGWSALGIAVWNTALISFGYFFSEKILSMLVTASSGRARQKVWIRIRTVGSG